MFLLNVPYEGCVFILSSSVLISFLPSLPLSFPGSPRQLQMAWNSPYRPDWPQSNRNSLPSSTKSWDGGCTLSWPALQQVFLLKVIPFACREVLPAFLSSLVLYQLVLCIDQSTALWLIPLPTWSIFGSSAIPTGCKGLGHQVWFFFVGMIPATCPLLWFLIFS